MSAAPGSGASPDDWRQAFGLLDGALDLAPEARGRWLQSLPDDQQRLRPFLRDLLQTHGDKAGDDFLRVPAIEALASLSTPRTPSGDSSLPRHAPHPPHGPHAASAEAEAGHGVVGPYRLLRRIGEGGMASVWLAERADGLLERRVALKLPHQVWGAATFADRMARERNILASLEHPNIARLYDAGIAADGRPWLALELVDGEPIDVHAARRQLGTRARVALGVEVARAVAHAHARLVVHRDLKPSNILVDAAGHAHLLDFGIARLVDPRLADGGVDATLTQASGRALTPDYASPEQIRGDPIGTASDIYSLGVVLFELLAGERPYRLKKGQAAGALAEAIARAEVPRPSRVCADAARAAQLRGDLDAILGRALAKAPGERYASVAAFADDLERHLRGEPVQARPPSPGYRAERWLRRHKVEAAIVAAVVVALLGGAYAQVLVVLALAVGAAAALWQRNRAREETERARVALARAEQVKQFIASIFSQAVPRNGQGGPVTAVGLLQAATQRIETDLSGQPEVAAELGVLIGSSFNTLGEVQAGFEWLPRASALCTRALGATHPLTLQSRWRLVEAANSIGRLDVSEPMLPALVQDVRGARPARPELLAEVLRSHAFVHTKRGREPEAMAALHEAVELAAKHFGEASEEALMSRASLSNTYKHFGRHGEALQSIEPALALARAAFGARRPHDVLHWVERAYADALARNRRPRDAAAILRQVLADQELLDAGASNRVRIVISTLAQALALCGCFEESDAEWARAEALLDGGGGLDTDEGAAQAAGRALSCVLAGRADDALAHLARAEARRGERSEGQVLTLGRECVRVLAQAMNRGGHDALAAADRLLARDDIDATVRVRAWRARAVAARLAGDTAAASRAAAEGIGAAEVAGSGDLERGLIEAEAARCSLAAGDAAAAALHFDAAIEVWQAGQVDGPALAALRAEHMAATRAPAAPAAEAVTEKIPHGMA